jgi:hypothetical protein
VFELRPDRGLLALGLRECFDDRWQVGIADRERLGVATDCPIEREFLCGERVPLRFLRSGAFAWSARLAATIPSITSGLSRRSLIEARIVSVRSS